jgi:hypothetical protein
VVFRAVASTALNEIGFRSDERQLAHQERDSVCAASKSRIPPGALRMRIKKAAPAKRIRSKRYKGRSSGKNVTIHLTSNAADAVRQRAKALNCELPESRSNADYASDPIPEDAVGLLDAFIRIHDANWEKPDLFNFDEDEIQEIRKSVAADLRKFVGDDYRDQGWSVDEFVPIRLANIFLRRCIEDRQLTPCIRDPETGEILRASHSGWSNIEFPEGDYGWPFDNHVHPDDPYSPGPDDVIVRGKARPVFFLRDHFDAWFQKTFRSNTGKRPGRKLGSGALEALDEPLLEKMRIAIENGSASSPNDAALMFADQAAGRGNSVSKATRLAKGYRKKFSDGD